VKTSRSSWALAAVAVLLTDVAVSRAASEKRASASSNLALSVAIDRADATYAQGTPVRFTITVQSDQQPVNDAEVQWTISKDGVPPITEGIVRLTNGSATVIGRLDEPGFLHCRAVFRGANYPTRTAVAGAAIDPLLIKPSLPVPFRRVGPDSFVVERSLDGRADDQCAGRDAAREAGLSRAVRAQALSGLGRRLLRMAAC